MSHTSDPMLHPKLQKWLPRMIHPQAHDPRDLTVEQMRTLDEPPTPGTPAQVAQVRDVVLPGEVAARLYVPDAAPSDALILFFHGGGYAVGTLGSHDTLCRQLTNGAGVALLSVDYPLAPEQPFPAGVDCAARVLDWVMETGAEALGLKVRHVAVVGDSAGGGMAASTALYARERGHDLRVQGLIYPMLDCDFDRPSYQQYAAGCLNTAPMMRWFWRHYLGGATDQSDDPRAVPLRAETFAGLAPAVVLTVEHDTLRDEGLAYAEALSAANVPVVARHLDDMTHGVFNLVTIFEPARVQLDWFGRELAARLHDP